MIKVVIVDDHQIFVDGVKALLEQMNEITVVGEANNGVELIECLSKTECDVVLMDVNMPIMDGMEATQKVTAAYPNLKVLMLTMHDRAVYIEKLIKSGASGYVLKNTKKEELLAAITAVYNGESYYSAEVTKRIMEGLQKKSSAQKSVGNVSLTDRELEVIKLIVKELTTHEIADELCISHHTVESHRKNLISKLQVRGISGLVKYAVESGLAD
jgi:DNA-binding NarL/FixJ family response regulator